MSFTTIQAECRVAGVLVDAAAVTLSDSTAAYGVRRTDTLAAVVAAGTAMTRVSTGIYTYQLEDPAASLVYEYVVKATFGAISTYQSGTAHGGGTSESALTTLDSRITPYAPGVQPAMVHQLERETFLEFCQESEIWRVKVKTVTLALQAAYTLTLPYRTSLMKVLTFSIADVPVDVEPLTPGATAITLATAPTTGGEEIVAWVVVIPDDIRTTAPGWFLKRFGRGIAAGVLSKLKRMENQRWSAPQEAREHAETYRRAVVAVRIEGAKWRGDEHLMAVPFY